MARRPLAAARGVSEISRNFTQCGKGSYNGATSTFAHNKNLLLKTLLEILKSLYGQVSQFLSVIALEGAVS